MKKHLFLFLTSTFLSIVPIVTQAQTYTPSNRTPQQDNSIGTIVNPTGTNNFNITGGLNLGQNLFHSFTDFSVPTGGAANFTNPAGNQSIITRVTGNLFSDINGLVNTNGANFLLINPNGVVFGTNAQLNVGKAFVTSTANGIDFVDAAGRNYNFGVNQAGDAPLLSIGANVAFNPARLIMGGSNSGSKGIENYGILRTNNSGQYIGLIGGNINFNGGQIIAPGAKVELGGLGQTGTVGFSLDNGVQFPVNVDRGNVSLLPNGTAPSAINVESGGGGSVRIVAKDITMQGIDTGIKAGIGAGLGSLTATTGDIRLDATGDVRLSDRAAIANRVNIGAEGKAGGIEISAGNLFVTNGAQLVDSILGKGDAGKIKIKSTGDIFFDDVKDDVRSAALSKVEKGGEGNAGGVELVARNLSFTNGAGLTASTLGKGDGGSIKITATGNISFDGNKNGYSGSAFSRVEQGGEGKAGGIEIITRNLAVTNGGQLSASTYGKGDAGSIKITATGNVSFDGSKDGFSSAAFSTVATGADGKVGGIEIATPNLSVTNGAKLSTSTYGKGDAGSIKITATGNVSFDNGNAFSTVEEKDAQGKGGNIEIVTPNLSVTNSGQLEASTKGKGDAGNIKITATGNVYFDGVQDGFGSAAISQVEEGAQGKGGNISIGTPNLFVTNGAQLSASTFGQGDAGNIQITATGNIIFDGRKDGSGSGAGSTAEAGSDGNGGSIEIVARNLFVTNSAQLQVLTQGQGNAGNLKITTVDRVSFDGGQDIFPSAAFSTVATGSQGKGGGIEIFTRNLSVSNGARLSATSQGTKEAGSISLNGDTITLNNGYIGSKSTNATGGNINLLTTDYLLLRNDSLIATDSDSTGKKGNGGNVTINSPLIIATPGNNDITANAYQGNGGRVNITSQGLFGIQYRPQGSSFTNDITASSTFGQSGNVQINTPGVDPGKDTGELPAAPNDASRQISQTCSASQRDNKFYITGRGGLPPNASEPQESEALWQDARAVKHKPATTANQPAQLAPPAIGWVFEQNGRVRLIAAQTAGGVTGTRAICPNVRK
jgi:filamentous hemagglutinin family protein